MTGHGGARARIWVLAVAAITLIAGHGIVLYYFSSHVALSALVVSGAIILMVIKHLGLLAAFLGPRYRRNKEDPPQRKSEPPKNDRSP